MRPFALILPLALCAAAAQAQPDNNAVPPVPVTIFDPPKPPAFVPPPLKPRIGTPLDQARADIVSFIQNLNTNVAFMSNDGFVHGTRVGYYGANEWAQNWKERKIQLKPDDIKIENLHDDQGTGTVTIIYHMESELAPLDARFKELLKDGATESFQLRKERMFDLEQWQLVPPEKLDPADPKTGVIAYVAYVLAQKNEVFTDALPYAFNTEGTKSLSNLKQLVLGALQYTQDYDELYAFAPKYLQEALMPYVKSMQIFRIPATQQSYTFNANLSGKTLAAIAEPARTIAFYEGENQQPIFRYQGRAAIGYADGHCVLVTPEKLKDAIWEVRLQRD